MTARTVPLWICFVLTILAFTGGFTGSLWTTLNRAAVSSVGDLSSVFQATVANDLEYRLESVLERMLLVLNGWQAVPRVETSTVEDAFSYIYGVMSRTPDVEGMSYTRLDGEIAGGITLPTGGIAVVHRPPSAYGEPANMTYWLYNGTLGKQTYTVTLDARQRQWYSDAISAGVPVFTYSFRTAVTTVEVISLATALYYPNQTVAGVLVVGFPFSALTDELSTALQELRSSGMLLLIEQNSGKQIASATASPATLGADLLEVQSFVQSSGSALSSVDVQHAQFSTFGDSAVLQVLISPNETIGLQWRLVVVLPDSDYYSGIWRLSRVAGAEGGAILVVFLLTVIGMTHLLVTRPLRMLTRHIDQLRMTLLSGDSAPLGTTVHRRHDSHGTSVAVLLATTRSSGRHGSNSSMNLGELPAPAAGHASGSGGTILDLPSPTADDRSPPSTAPQTTAQDNLTTAAAAAAGSSSRFSEIRELYRRVVAAL
eukprot:RCo020794